MVTFRNFTCPLFICTWKLSSRLISLLGEDEIFFLSIIHFRSLKQIITFLPEFVSLALRGIQGSSLSPSIGRLLQ